MTMKNDGDDDDNVGWGWGGTDGADKAWQYTHQAEGVGGSRGRGTDLPRQSVDFGYLPVYIG